MPKYTKVTKFGLQVTCVVGPRKNGRARGRKKAVKKVIVYKYKLCLALLYLADMFINKLTVNDLINAHSQINASDKINAPPPPTL